MSETSTLIGYQGRTIPREALDLVPTPPATATHRPIPHHEVVQALIETLGFRHIGVVQDEYAVSPWTYLGRRDLHSSLVYITVTQELLHRASERFRAFGVHVVTGSGGPHENDQLSAWIMSRKIAAQPLPHGTAGLPLFTASLDSLRIESRSPPGSVPRFSASRASALPNDLLTTWSWKSFLPCSGSQIKTASSASGITSCWHFFTTPGPESRKLFGSVGATFDWIPRHRCACMGKDAKSAYARCGRRPRSSGRLLPAQWRRAGGTNLPQPVRSTVASSGRAIPPQKIRAERAQKVPRLSDKRISPHTFRHTATVHLLAFGVDAAELRADAAAG